MSRDTNSPLVWNGRKFPEMAQFAASVFIFSGALRVWPLALYAFIVVYLKSKQVDKKEEFWWNVFFVFNGVVLVILSFIYFVNKIAPLFAP